MNDISFALYRKYRPEKFDEVRNQDHIISVLKGALKKKMIPHALLFAGSRGTGKTTVARIFARELGAHQVDVYEIDAASNRGIDDIRELKEAVHTLPFRSPYKVYIIDEVHMLTKEAFNALLKTLEEPPAHVIFILATTEKDRLLDTITSRCQVFEFHAPVREELRDTVLSIAKKEKFKLNTQAADVIALSADGSYRDALGIMQKVIMASSDKELSVDEVSEIVGAPKTTLLEDIIKAIAEKDLESGLEALRKASSANVDIKLFYRLLVERIRSVILLRYNAASEDELLSQYGEDEKKLIIKYAKEQGSPVHSHLLLKALKLGQDIGRSHIGMLPLELLLIEACKDKE
jgi:DNA polymerase-3 subunit gamma/tau